MLSKINQLRKEKKKESWIIDHRFLSNKRYMHQKKKDSLEKSEDMVTLDPCFHM